MRCITRRLGDFKMCPIAWAIAEQPVCESCNNSICFQEKNFMANMMVDELIYKSYCKFFLDAIKNFVYLKC